MHADEVVKAYAPSVEGSATGKVVDARKAMG
jgi:hypothetical protein